MCLEVEILQLRERDTVYIPPKPNFQPEMRLIAIFPILRICFEARKVQNIQAILGRMISDHR